VLSRGDAHFGDGAARDMTVKSEPRFFKTQAQWRAWLEKNHATKDELQVGLYRNHAAHLGVTYKQALDEALCFGWIDAVRHSIDADHWTIRFTPRKKSSIWSKVNLKRAQELLDEGLMHEAGKRAFLERNPKRQGLYSFENQPQSLTPELEQKLRANKKAWAFFAAEPPWYQRTCTFWVMSAKKDETRARRFAELLADSASGVRIKLTRYGPAKKAKA
jgi:uncharacterized protein YdeI (YjbR/CyaY-like superfamily)